MADNRRVFGLDLLRTIAVLMVLVSHSRFLNNHFPQLSILGNFGFLGVELFFVLSGFLIGGILIKSFENECNFPSLKTFWIRRWFRTLPNYYLFLLINIFLFLFLQFPIGNWYNYLGFFQNLAWPRPWFYRESWSLAVEEWFYLIYPLTVILLVKMLKIDIKKSFFYAALLFSLFPFLFRIYAFFIKHYEFGTLRMIVFSRLDAMMAGVFMAYIKYYYSALFKRFSLAFLAISVVCFGYVFAEIFIYRQFEHGGWVNVYIFNILTIALAGFLPVCFSFKTVKNIYVSVFVEKIALWSYSLYLINIPVEYCLIYAQEKFNWFGIYQNLILILFFGLSV
jgi:peptidoglycan/LPS O-acetylase OafA/YrhL